LNLVPPEPLGSGTDFCGESVQAAASRTTANTARERRTRTP
jgi:hypothetical protein